MPCAEAIAGTGPSVALSLLDHDDPTRSNAAIAACARAQSPVCEAVEGAEEEEPIEADAGELPGTREPCTTDGSDPDAPGKEECDAEEPAMTALATSAPAATTPAPAATTAAHITALAKVIPPAFLAGGGGGGGGGGADTPGPPPPPDAGLGDTCPPVAIITSPQIVRNSPTSLPQNAPERPIQGPARQQPTPRPAAATDPDLPRANDTHKRRVVDRLQQDRAT